MLIIILNILQLFGFLILGVICILGTFVFISLLLQYYELITLSSSSSLKSKLFHQNPPEPSFSSPSSLGYFSFTKKWSSIMDSRTSEMLPKPHPSLSTHPGIANALDTWLFYLTRDFIDPWYQSISNDTVFLDLLQIQSKTMLKRVLDRFSQIPFYHFLVEKWASLLIQHLVQVHKAEVLMRGTKIDKVFTESLELHELEASKYKQGILHPCLMLKSNGGGRDVSELNYLRTKLESILPYLLSPHDCKSPILRTFLRELLVCVVVKPVIEMLSDPFHWYQIMDSLVGTAIKDLNLVSKFRKVLERQAKIPTQPIPIHSYDDLLKLIRQCKSLAEAKKIRNLIVMEVRRRRMIISERPMDDVVNGVKVSDMIKQMKRLLYAKSKIEQQIVELGGTPQPHTPLLTPSFSPMMHIPSSSSSSSPPPPNCTNLLTIPSAFTSASLSYILSNPYGLSSFMEFMERKNQSNVLQFYLMAQTFREHFANPASLPTSLYQDFLQIYHRFFAVNSPDFIQLPLGLSLKLNQAAIQSSTSEILSNDLWIDAFQCILDAQHHIFQTMEQQEYGPFLRSDLYLFLLNHPGFSVETPSPITPSSNSDLDQFHVSLLNETDLLPTDVVETVEEELKSILSCETFESPSLSPSSSTHSTNTTASTSSSLPLETMNEDSLSSSPTELDTTLNETDTNEEEDILTDLSQSPSSIRQEIDKLAQQEAIVDTLIEKARKDVRNDGLVKVLQKSKRTLRGEIRELFWQEQQVKRSDSSHILPGKCSVKVISHTTGRNDTKAFALYKIEVRQCDSAAPGWIVHRRFSEFLLLHKLLKAKFPPFMQSLELPKKAPNVLLGTHILNKLTNERQGKLNEYLQRLSKSPEICQSDVFRRFICLEHLDRGWLSIHPKKASFLKQLQKKFLNGWEAWMYSNAFPSTSSSTPMTTPNNKTSSTSTSTSTSSSNVLGSTTSTTPSPFTDHLPDRASDVFCELFIELFELREKNNWLRRQAVSILLQQILGETIERKLTESLNYYSSKDMIVFYLDYLRKSLWPGGRWKAPSNGPTLQERERIKHASCQKLISFIPEILGGFVGRQNATKGALKIHSLVHNPVLNRHFLYSTFDMLLEELFPEIRHG